MPAPDVPAAVSFIDSHAHLDMQCFDDDRDAVVERAIKAGLTRIINVGIDLPSSRKAIEMARCYPIVSAAAGIHPQDSKAVTQADIATLSELERDPAVVAIGEIGLDFYRDYSPHEQQMNVLRWQLELARELGKPVIIHSRQAEKEIAEILTEWSHQSPPRSSGIGVIHCFNGDLAQAKSYLNLGFYISVGAYIGYPSSKALRDVVKQLPLDRVLIETDSPFLPPQEHRGERNEPAYVVEAAKQLAAVKGLGLQEVASQTTENARRLFSIAN